MTLIQELNQTKNRIGLVNGTLTIKEYKDLEENISASIDPKTWNIEFNLRLGYNPIQDRRQKAYARRKKIIDPKKQMLEDILHHELCHWEMPFTSGYGCPYDTYNHDLISEAVKSALPENKQQHASYVVNVFEDLLVNTRCREVTENFAGQVLFFDEQGTKLKDGIYTPFYEAFVKLNMHLWLDSTDRSLVKRHFKNTKKVDAAVSQVIRELGLQDKENITQRLFRKESWPELARKFAIALAPLLDEPPKEKLSAYTPQDSNKKSGNGVEEKASTKEGKGNIAKARYTNGKGLSPNIEASEQVDAVYRDLARAIPVKVEAMTREQSMAIAPLNYRPFDEEKDDVQKIKPKKLFVVDNELIPGYPKSPIVISARSKIQARDFPDFKMVILDDSGSMKHGLNCNMSDEGNMKCNGSTLFIPWGNKSKYHYSRLGFEGVELFLQEQGIAQYINHGLSLFSSTTRYQESDFASLYKLRRLASSPEFGNTRLDANVLVNALRGRKSFVLSISDGEVENWASVKPEFLELVRDNFYGHIQLGSRGIFANDLASEGLPVFDVNHEEELPRLMVNIAHDTYKRFTTR